MKRRHKALVVIAALVAQLAVAVTVAGHAGASAGPADDRRLTTPTRWWTYTGVTAAQVGNLLSANHARLTSIEVDSSAPTFTVVMVSDSGAYASGWWWYYGQTQSQVSSLLSTNHARLVSADAYATGSGTRYAVVMVANSGATAKAWWWYIGSTSFLSSQLSANHARMIEVSPMPGSTSTYLGLMVANTGTDNTAWWWYVHASVSAVSNALSANHARLVDLSRNDDGSYNVVMYANSGTRWYWYVNQAPATAVTRAAQQGERVIDAWAYTVSGTRYYAVIETRNTNALSEKLWNVIAPTVDSGKYGFYLARVGGRTLAGIGQSVQYEPASALKVLYHAKSIHEESLGSTTDATVITYHYHDLSDPQDGDICPDNYATTTTTNLKNADTLMMQNSDNRMTRGIVEKYTKSAMLSYANALGMTSTQINHNIGCPTSTTHNRTTLVDLGKVYAAFQNGTITSNATWQTQFRSRMLNQSNYSGFRNSICPIVSQEASAQGKSTTTATAFCNAMTWIAKGGSYQYGSALPYQVSWGGVSLTGVPFRSGGVVAPHYYVFGEYVDGTTINSTTEANTINAARSKLYQECLRSTIAAALQTW